MSIHSGMSFSTFDQDNDASGGSCSNWYGQAGNWFNDCYDDGQNLNGVFGVLSGNYANIMSWALWSYDDPYIKTSRMMFRSVD